MENLKNNQQSNTKRPISWIKWGLIGIVAITISYTGYQEISHILNPCESPRGKEQKQQCDVKVLLENAKRTNKDVTKFLAEQYATRSEVREHMPELAEQYPEEVNKALAIEVSKSKIMAIYEPESNRLSRMPKAGRPLTEQEVYYIEQVVQCAQTGESVHGCPVPISNTPELYKPK